MSSGIVIWPTYIEMERKYKKRCIKNVSTQTHVLKSVTLDSDQTIPEWQKGSWAEVTTASQNLATETSQVTLQKANFWN